MGIRTDTKVHRLDARVILDPTSLGSYPYGGSDVGAVSKIAWTDGSIYTPITSAEFGCIINWVRSETVMQVGMMLRQFDADALDAAFESTAIGSSSGDPIASVSRDAGIVQGGRQRKVLIVPERSDQPGLLLYSAMGVLDSENQTDMSILAEASIPLVFMCIPDNAGRLYQWGRVEDMTL